MRPVDFAVRSYAGPDTASPGVAIDGDAVLRGPDPCRLVDADGSHRAVRAAPVVRISDWHISMKGLS